MLAKSQTEEAAMQGQVAFGKMEEVIFGKPVAEAAPALIDRLGASRGVHHVLRHIEPRDVSCV